jgi:hypothetical protein
VIPGASFFVRAAYRRADRLAAMNNLDRRLPDRTPITLARNPHFLSV